MLIKDLERGKMHNEMKSFLFQGVFINDIASYPLHSKNETVAIICMFTARLCICIDIIIYV